MTKTDGQDRIGADSSGDAGQSQAPRELSPAALRALQEAAERRARREQEDREQAAQSELGGRAGPDPVRYGDWENGGIASDF